jgi:hypothetical protein
MKLGMESQLDKMRSHDKKGCATMRMRSSMVGVKLCECPEIPVRSSFFLWSTYSPNHSTNFRCWWLKTRVLV